MVDTGAQFSVFNHPMGIVQLKESLVQGVTRVKAYHWSTRRSMQPDCPLVKHSFLVEPDCPAPLLGRNLLTQVRAQMHFQPEGISIMDREGQPLSVLTLSISDEYRFYETNHKTPTTKEIAPWLKDFSNGLGRDGGIGLAHRQCPVMIELKPFATRVWVKQFPLRPEAIQAITPY